MHVQCIVFGGKWMAALLLHSFIFKITIQSVVILGSRAHCSPCFIYGITAQFIAGMEMGKLLHILIFHVFKPIKKKTPRYTRHS